MTDYHLHTCYCDGADTPRSMVEAAISLGMKEIGICTHGFTPFDQRYCIKKEDIPIFLREVNSLKEEFKGQIKVLAGVEADVFSDFPTDGFDYVIASCHYLKNGDIYTPIDENKEELTEAVNRFYGGDFISMCSAYYKSVSSIRSKKCDIIGHIDLVRKFNGDGSLFDEKSEDYLSLVKSTVDALIPLNVPFEINTGAISRGYRNTPYPDEEIIRYIKASGGKLILSSDAHSAKNLCFRFKEYEELADFTSILV